MGLADGIVVGGDILPDSHFGSAAFYEDWSRGMDFETSSAPANTTGKWKVGHWADNISSEGGVTFATGRRGNGYNYLHDGNNEESQAYVTPRDPAPSGVNPFEIIDGKLVITSAPVLPEDADWARVKKVVRDANKNKISNASTHPDGSPVLVHPSDPQLSANFPCDYTSGMITTNGRFAMSFGRFRWRAKSPYGADGSGSDYNAWKAVFPAAAWLLREYKYGCDVNGEPFPNEPTKTYSPAAYYRNSAGVLVPTGGTPEIDVDESFGSYYDYVHQTAHLHSDTTGNLIQNASEIDVNYDIRSNWTESGVDLIPIWSGGEVVGGVIAWFINGRYSKTRAMPEEMWRPQFIFNTVPGRDFEEESVSDQIQRHANGDPRYMRWFMLTNLARDGKYPRELAEQRHGSSGQPPHADTCSLELDYCGAWPLLDDNPDTFGLSFRGVPQATDSGASFDDSAPSSTGGGTAVAPPGATAPVINPGQFAADRTFTPVFADEFATDGPGPGPHWGYDTGDDALNRTGTSGIDENGTVHYERDDNGNIVFDSDGRPDYDSDFSVPGRRWGGYMNGPNDSFVRRENGLLRVGGAMEVVADPTRPNFTWNGTYYGLGEQKFYTPYMSQVLRRDPANSPGIYFGPGHYFEARVSWALMKMRGYRMSWWLTPTPPNEGKMYDDNAANGVEIDIFEVERWLRFIGSGSFAGWQRLQAKVLGGEAGSTTDQGGGNVDVTSFGIDEGFHTIGLLWLRDRLHWYLDGVEIIRQFDLVPQVDMMMSITRELNYGITNSDQADPDHPDRIPSDDLLRKADPGLYVVNAYLDRDLIDEDEGLFDYVRVYSVDGENALSSVTAGGTRGDAAGTSTAPVPANADATSGGTGGNTVVVGDGVGSGPPIGGGNGGITLGAVVNPFARTVPTIERPPALAQGATAVCRFVPADGKSVADYTLAWRIEGDLADRVSIQSRVDESEFRLLVVDASTDDDLSDIVCVYEEA